MTTARSPSPGAKGDDFYRINVLLNRAASSSSNREKNSLMCQIRALTNEHFQKADRLFANNAIKTKELEGLEKSYSDIQQQLELVKGRLSLLNLLKRRAMNSDLTVQSDIIRTVEKDLLSYGTMERESLVSDCADSEFSREEKIIMMHDIRMQRIEELIYMLQKRIISVEQNQECSEQIFDEFGSVFGLIDVFKSLQIENQKLKREESVFLDDAITRRRISTHISQLMARSMTVLLQRELKQESELLSRLGSQRDMFRSISHNKIPAQRSGKGSRISLERTRSVMSTGARAKPSPKGNTTVDAVLELRPDFDSMCNDPDFVLSNKMTVMPSGRMDSAVVVDLSPQEAIEETLKQIEVAKDQEQKVMKELEEKRKFSLSPEKDSGTRVVRLVELNQRMMSQIATVQDELTAKNEEIERLMNKLTEVVSSRNYYSVKGALVFPPFRNLLKDNNILKFWQAKNKGIITTLYSICCQIGYDLLDSRSVRDTPISSVLVPTIEEQEFEAMETQRRKEEERRKEKRSEKKAKPSLGDRFTVKVEASKSRGDMHFDMPTVLPMNSRARTARRETRNKFELYSLLTHTADCGSCCNGGTDFHKRFMKMWRHLEHETKDVLNNNLAELLKWQCEQMKRLKEAYRGILVREMAEVETMTDNQERREEEVQTVDVKTDAKKAKKATPKIIAPKPTTSTTTKKKI